SDPMLKGAYIVSLVDISSLRAAEKERDEALRFLSHDLRSPQASILSLVDLLRSSTHAPDLPSSLSMISTYASRTIALAEGFVEQARLANQALRWHPCDLSELLNAAVDECWAQATAKQIHLIVPEPLPPHWSVAAGDLLFRSLVNLINNAIKYSPPGSTVRAHIVKREQGWGLSIQDQGRGMRPEDLARLKRFEAFTRIAAPEGEAEEGGFGLGLRFVDMVARRHAGYLDIESELGKGSGFTLNIWVNQPEPVLESEPSAYNHDA
ncbi:MAG: HAMP domain-containing histidine kinase, partial [Pigmentiphaga sp.]|nr:HAMP domain-containing histidine kinase [Pigmentiphaga sp.]